MFGEMSSTSSGMPQRHFRAFSRQAEEAPSRGEVLPVTSLPFGSSMATAGAPVSSARARAAGTTARLSGLRPIWFISSSSLKTSSCSERPWRREQRLW